jgi:hypothetical protein
VTSGERDDASSPDTRRARTLDAAQRDVLGRLKEHVTLFGVANDADDHQCGAEGADLRRRGAEAIRALLEEHAFVAELLPSLRSELTTRHIEGFGWSNLVDLIDGLLAPPHADRS